MIARAKAGALRCVICGSSKNVELHHVGGRNHVAWFILALCRAHHAELHGFLLAAGINLEYTPDPLERYLRVQQAFLVAQWVLTKAQEESILPNAEHERECRSHA